MPEWGRCFNVVVSLMFHGWGVRLSKAADDPEEFLSPLWYRTTVAHNNGGKKWQIKQVWLPSV